VFPFQDGEAALGPDFTKPHHGQVFWSSHTLVPSEKCRIATAGQHSAPNSSLVKTARPFWTAHTGIALDLVATQIFARRFAAI